jgi:hypothetical protein
MALGGPGGPDAALLPGAAGNHQDPVILKRRTK